MSFYPEYSVQVNKSHVISVTFSEFWLHHAVCSQSLFQEQKQTSMKEAEEVEGGRHRERVNMSITPLYPSSHMFVFVFLLSSEFLNKVMR